jgi:hypothetical protein
MGNQGARGQPCQHLERIPRAPKDPAIPKPTRVDVAHKHLMSIKTHIGYIKCKMTTVHRTDCEGIMALSAFSLTHITCEEELLVLISAKDFCYPILSFSTASYFV